MRCYSFQSIGTCSFSLIFLSKRSSMFAVASMFDFSNSVGMFSCPTAFPFLICLMAMLIVGEAKSIGWSVCTASMPGGFSGARLFIEFFKVLYIPVPMFLNLSD
ncbi:tripeptidyl-peptidase II Tpp2, variant 2 [Schistosoma haematobium]|uniref:Tripeptidyl-peptidase II Tpp2, variant 2 n=1 Tax=Schistosoma haematobium TaxID=6185 RepID=A0A922IKB4_SCHHA|nr:tripeptidyl-peptidase II Tpp2, variant 2 [Schistosoma haematobium]KAH9581129.1 tripeptidyl-peptidase II Tpp2, variant 2 [Schistosoma haematobium]